jgi:hypothetical protein
MASGTWTLYILLRNRSTRDFQVIFFLEQQGLQYVMKSKLNFFFISFLQIYNLLYKLSNKQICYKETLVRSKHLYINVCFLEKVWIFVLRTMTFVVLLSWVAGVLSWCASARLVWKWKIYIVRLLVYGACSAGIKRLGTEIIWRIIYPFILQGRSRLYDQLKWFWISLVYYTSWKKPHWHL